jgi:hypothetical protein
MHVTVGYLDVLVGGNYVDLSAFETCRLVFVDYDYRQRAASIENSAEMAGTLRIEMLCKDDGSGKVLTERAYES